MVINNNVKLDCLKGKCEGIRTEIDSVLHDGSSLLFVECLRQFSRVKRPLIKRLPHAHANVLLK
jgi:hypothetical protein